MDEKSKNRMEIGLLMVVAMFCVVALYAAFQVAFFTYNPAAEKNVTDLFHGIPAIVCAVYCGFVCVKKIARLRKND